MSLRGRLVPLDRARLTKFMKYTGMGFVVLTLFIGAVILNGGAVVAGTLLVEAAMFICGAIGNRVEGSNRFNM